MILSSLSTYNCMTALIEAFKKKTFKKDALYLEFLFLLVYFKKFKKLYEFVYLEIKPLLKPRHLSIVINNYIL